MCTRNKCSYVILLTNPERGGCVRPCPRRLGRVRALSCCFRLCAFPAPATMSTEQPVPTEIPAALLPLLGALSSLLYTLQSLFHKVPGSPIILRYIKSSYQNDPWRSLLEVLLVAFALRTLLKGRTRGDEEGKSFIKLTEKVSF